MIKMHLLNYFEETVDNNFDVVAVKHNNQSIKFGELREKAKKLGTYLVAQTKGVINNPVAVFLPKEIYTVISDIGIMYSHNVFMNLDVKMPMERLENIVALTKPVAIVTSAKYSERFSWTDTPIILIDEIEMKNISVKDEYLSNRNSKIIDTDPFCIINTSGSTGTPKGVVLNYRSFLDFMTVSNEIFKFDGSEIIGSLSPVVFDIYNFELCMLMINGSCLVLLDSILAAFPARLLKKIADSKVSFIFWVPSIMVNIANLNLLDRIPLPDLKLVWFAGEVFPTKQFLVWYDNLPNTVFANLYGPIEITLDCTYYIINKRPNESEPLPIGIPYRNTDVMILNDENRLCDIGEEGELCVRGTSLAMGYYNNFEKTAAAFVQNPLNTVYPEIIYRTGDVVSVREDGNIMFKGRKDSLIKHMGYRIELGEIEHVIENNLKLVKYCCAVYRYSSKEIVLYYESESKISEKEFRTKISKVFPAYMIPSVFIRMDNLPKNTNGKIDRLILKNMANEEDKINE